MLEAGALHTSRGDDPAPAAAVVAFRYTEQTSAEERAHRGLFVTRVP